MGNRASAYRLGAICAIVVMTLVRFFKPCVFGYPKNSGIHEAASGHTHGKKGHIGNGSGSVRSAILVIIDAKMTVIKHELTVNEQYYRHAGTVM